MDRVVMVATSYAFDRKIAAVVDGIVTQALHAVSKTGPGGLVTVRAGYRRRPQLTSLVNSYARTWLRRILSAMRRENRPGDKDNDTKPIAEPPPAPAGRNGGERWLDDHAPGRGAGARAHLSQPSDHAGRRPGGGVGPGHRSAVSRRASELALLHDASGNGRRSLPLRD
jgi:hypothetical protein